MEEKVFGQAKTRLYVCNTAVVGTGAAGYGAANRLWQYGQKDILMVTEKRRAGTSRNTGSDKQTYYKLTLSGGEPDSVREMADTLFSGRCVDGDLALCEAALSVQEFLKLAELGVPFPKNRYGEYVGYKTDHDPRRRAASAGPYTSRLMTEKLEEAADEKGIPILDGHQVIRILSDGKKAYGLLCLDTDVRSQDNPFVLIQCKNIVYAAGGPAGMYADSVYPFGHYGASGLAFEAGARGKNLTEWQYGMASVKPRWNVSGTYMQVLPRVFSARPDGTGEREFLTDFFKEPSRMLSKLFLKGYQWPFDVEKIEGGSSVIDILVYLETCKGRRVYLDYRCNPGGGAVDFGSLDRDAREYLEKAGACFGTPIERLEHMNAPAVDFYRDKGVDLHREPLEIALCAQHNNGGLSVDCWWQTDVEGLFAAGEAAGTHGVYRPGGTALNAGQVGSARAARYIAARRQGKPEDGFEPAAEKALEEMEGLARRALAGTGNVRKLWEEAGRRMSRWGGAMRNPEEITGYLAEVKGYLDNFADLAAVEKKTQLQWLYRLRDMLISQYVYLYAMNDYVEKGGKSRGSALYTDPEGKKPYEGLPEMFRFTLDDGRHDHMIQEIFYRDGDCGVQWRRVRPIPKEDDFFENVWREYRRDGNIR